MGTRNEGNSNEALLWALIDKKVDNMKKAIADGADVNLSSPEGSRPLHAAALRGSAWLIHVLVQGNAEVDCNDQEDFTPLMVAALNGKTDAVMALLTNGADPNRKRQHSGETALHMAMNGGSTEVVTALLKREADINAHTTKDKFTALHFAAKFNARELAEALLCNLNCQKDAKDKQGRTAAQVARDEGHYRLAEYLDMHTTRTDENDEKLVSAVMKLDKEAAERALTAGAKVNISSPTGSRPLHAAALRDSVQLINILVKHGAEVNQADCMGFTALMVAALNGRVDAVTALLANRADPNQKRLDTGETALHMAMDGGSGEVVKALIENRADINAQTTKDKFTPLHLAALLGVWESMDVLKNHPLRNKNLKDSKNRTADQLSKKHDFGETKQQDTPDGKEPKVQRPPLEPVPPSSDVYKVTSSPRGMVLLLNYENFANEKKRYGAAKDEENLNYLFTKMGYKVRVCRDLSYNDTRSELDKLRKEESLRDVDCVIVWVSSHGKNRNTFCTLDEDMTVDEVHSFFTDDQCTSLRGKPKLFLFNFCRGSDTEKGCLVDRRKGKFTSLITKQFESRNLTAILKKHPLYEDRDRVKPPLAQLLEDLHRLAQTVEDVNEERQTKVWTTSVWVTTPQAADEAQPSHNMEEATSSRSKVLFLSYEFLEMEGTTDADNLIKLFKQAGCHVTVCRNLTYDETTEHALYFREELQDVDHAVACVLSYGEKTFYTSDGKEITAEEICRLFTDDDSQCPQLTVLLLTLYPKESEKGDDPKMIHKMGRTEVLKDQVSLYASVSGVKALRHPTEGTLFCQSIVETFAKSAHFKNVVELANKVNEYMTTNMGGTTTQIESTTTKTFYLNPTT